MIALIFCGDLKYCPYIHRYTELLEKAKKDYRIYFWNRSGISLNLSEKYIFYNYSSELNNGKVRKFFDFVRFRTWLIGQLEKNHYEKIIVLSTLTGVILGNYLYKRRGDYIFDIRDYSYEHILPFYNIEKKIIENSAFTTISSAGFKSFLPEYEFVIAHNLNRNEIDLDKKFTKAEKTINFVWNGMLRYFEFQRQYLDALKNDSRFNIIYHGDGPELEKYKSYCAQSGFINVHFTGSYDNSDKERLLLGAHILNNCYGYTHGNNNKVKYAVSNRFYDGIINHIPQLVEMDGFKPKWANSSGVGVSFPPNRDFANKLYDYYQSIDADRFNQSCERELKRIIDEDDIFVEKIKKFIE